MTGSSGFEKTVQISLLGGFRLAAGDKSIDDSIGRTRQLWNLLGYLIAFRHKTVSQESLIDMLWPDGKSENPANALKNLVYRIRSIFVAHDIPYAKDMILFRQGSYCWNNQIDCIVDIEQMEELKIKADNQLLPEDERLALYLKAIALYRGDFMSNSTCENWVIPFTSFYRTLYFHCVREAGSLLLKLERFREVLPLCEKAILIDPFEEVVHKLMIFALVRQGRHQEALRHYRYVNDLFYRELGVRPSESMRRLYDKITQAIHNTETDLDIIKESLKEPEANGAFTCDYEVFKNVYRLEARAASRLGRSVFLRLLTLLDANDIAPAKDVLAQEMDRLLAVINSSLRKGDVISRFSASQYILMLPNLTFENGQMVLDRIGKRFDVKNRTHGVHLNCTLHPMDPVI